ncbi:diaminopimelate decarboxylase [Streptomyces violascens]|uniref:Diaminopimelate decarboxylase n=1 Tax=Streptomyces violascens TaxID=67381 RepID=A0ABQ3R2N2_9ACTN|nr:diaminopimelate decarboxylase [Streptomyces violascens]GGT98121.1 diaminopimelate decarboxylase [Streptomyces violascens]GHI39800.1 diaminopimelate decarboxylase [Streptomyces violascens]GHI43791.1 diaminopimelate decarboxylase [Streptomyces violascens]
MTSQATSRTAKAAAAERREQAVRAAVEQGLAGPDVPIVALLDTTGIRAGAAALQAAFAAVTDAPVLHAFAVKACPLVPVLRLLLAEGLGAEVASPGELALARAAGIRPAATVLDSPAKTPAELREALALGIAVNADNPQELARLDALICPQGLEGQGGTPIAPSTSPLGIRVNPQLGAGSIDALSTATATSKFGVALLDEGARDWVVRAYAERPWLTRLHTHSGSQGVALSLMARGVRAVYELAEEINAAVGRQQVDTIDIGGGLPVNFGSDEETPTYDAYARLLKEEVPGLFDGRYGLVTEFGRSLLAKHGLVLARVEYAKSSGGRPIAVTHAGVQIAARTVYAPASWPLRIEAYDAKGRPKRGPTVAQDIAGPACFAGDLLAENRPLPLLDQGDYTGVLDTGAYYFAHHYSYNSLARPGIYGFTATADGVEFATVRSPQSLADLVEEAGGAHADALL